MDTQQTPPPKYSGFPHGGIYAVLSVGLYIASLNLPALFFEKGMHGDEVLTSGWAAIFIFNFAWFANLTYLISIINLISQNWKKALMWCGITIFLALNTFLFTGVPDTTGSNSNTPLTGYGWGFVCWGLAFLFMLATCISYEEENSYIQTFAKKPCRINEYIVLTVIAVTAAGSFYGYQTNDGKNTVADARGMVFSLMPECGREIPTVTQPIKNFSGVVQFIEVNPGGYTDTRSSMLFVEDLFNVGATTVQFDGIEYSRLNNRLTQKILTSDNSQAADAQVLRDIQHTREMHSIQIRVIESSTRRIVFDNTWETKEPQIAGQTRRVTCPGWQRYSESLGRVVYYPRQGLREAFGLQ